MRYILLLITVHSFLYANVSTQFMRNDNIVFPGGTNDNRQSRQRQRQRTRPVRQQQFGDSTFVAASAAAGGGAWANSWAGSDANVVSNAATNAFIQDYNNNYHQFNVNPLHQPHRPKRNRYRDFIRVFDDIDRKSESNYNTKLENSETLEDLNGRSIVAPGQYPHMAALGYRNNEGRLEFKCGGSLINEWFVITAAHCCFISGLPPNVIKFGDIRLKEREADVMPQRRRVADIFVHPLYNSSFNYNDIALVQLNKPIDYSRFVRPIRLWTSHEIPYEKVHTMGYGSTKFAQAITNILTELEKSIVPTEKCKLAYPPDEEAPMSIIESQICAQDYEKKRDTCQGDSGGPLQLNLERRRRRRRFRFYLVGITSYGKVCDSDNPGVYTRVSSYIDWIASIVWPDYFNQ